MFLLSLVSSRFFPNLLFAPEGGGGSGGSSEGGDPDEELDDEDEKIYTKSQYDAALKVGVEKALNKRMSKKEKELSEKTTQLAEKEARVAEVEAQIAALESGGALDAEQKKRLGTLELEHIRLERQVTDLTNKNAELLEKNTAEMSRRKNIERDQLLFSAFEKVGCLDHNNAKLIFRDRCEYDEDEERWLFRTQKQDLVEIEEGVCAEMPSYMIPAASRGGSGTTGTSTKKQIGLRKLDEKKAAYAAAQKKLAASNGQDNGALSLCRNLRLEIEGMEKTSK